MNANRLIHLRETYLIDKARKILPLYWAATLIVFILGLVLPQLFSKMTFDLNGLLHSILLIPGQTFYLFPGWTLTYFFEFYIIYCIADKLSKHRDATAISIITALVLIGFLLEQFVEANIITKYLNPIMLEFAYGITLSHIIGRVKIPKWMSYLSIVLFTVLFFNYKQYLWPRYIVPAILACVAITGFSQFEIRPESKICNALVKVGDISLTVYILHPLIVRPLDKVIIRVLGTYTSPIYVAGAIIIVILCICMCYWLTPFLRKVKLL